MIANKITYADKLRALRKRANLSLADLAIAAGYSHASGLQRYEDPNEFSDKPLPPKLVIKLAPHLVGRGDPAISEQEVYDLANLTGFAAPISADGNQYSEKSNQIPPSPDPTAPNIIRDVPDFGPRDLPVRGVAAAGTDALFITNGEPHDWIRRPPSLMGVSDAYAVFTAGSSMEPRYYDGEVVYVHPGRRVAAGPHTFVVVQFHTDEEGEAPRALVKKYEKQTSRELILSQFNPPEELRFPIKTVRSIHLIVTPLEVR